jgi:uncharacterized membrane protein
MIVLIAVLLCGLNAGVFFAFSAFVMPALARRPVPEAIAAMQAINVVVLRSLFTPVFIGAAVICALVLGLAGWELIAGKRSGAVWLGAAGAAVHVIGSFGVTAACNVPRNQRLARVRAGDPGADAVWQEYLVAWTRWNHVRTAASLVGAGLLAAAL